MYSHQALYLLVWLGTNQQKSAQKPTDIEILNWNIILIIERLRAKFCWLMKHIKISVKTEEKKLKILQILQIKLIN